MGDGGPVEEVFEERPEEGRGGHHQGDGGGAEIDRAGSAVILLLPQDLLRPVHPLGIRPPDMFM